MWRIDEVHAKRYEAPVRPSIFSHPFYTEVYGYKMCARLFLNGTSFISLNEDFFYRYFQLNRAAFLYILVGLR